MKEVGPPWAVLIFVLGLLAPALLLQPGRLGGQTPQPPAATPSTPPPSQGGFFPLADVRKGMMATAWTVFEGDKPEPMQVEILGILKGGRGPGQDMILARLRGPKPEYTGVVAGMSGSPVYIGARLLGSLSYRIGQFAKDPIAGITPIAQMLQVRDLPVQQGSVVSGPWPQDRDQEAAVSAQQANTGGLNLHAMNLQAMNLQGMDSPAMNFQAMNFQAMETPLVMSGFSAKAVALWQKQMAGTGLEMVAAGGSSGAALDDQPSANAAATIVPGSAVSAQLVRGDLDMSATCTVTYVDPKQLLACGHPLFQVGTVSLPMTTTDVVATLASPLNAFKIINTGELIGAFTEDRDSAIRGVFGLKPRMIPVHIALQSGARTRNLNVEVLDLPALTPQAVLLSLYESLLESNDSSAETSYHLTGSIELAPAPGSPGPVTSPLDEWASASDGGAASLMLALETGQRFARIYSNDARLQTMRAVNLHVEAIPGRVGVELEAARLISGDTVHAGDTVYLEATLRAWHQPARNVRIPVRLPARLGEGSVRILVSDAGTLDRALDPPRLTNKQPPLAAVLAQSASLHPADRIYVSVLVPETQAAVSGHSLASLPLSVANTLEPARSTQDVNLSGESARVAADVPAGGVLSGFQVLTVHIEPGGGLD